MVGELFAGIGAFKTIFDIAKSIKDIDDTVKRNAAVAELGEQIIAAQTRYAEAIEENRLLEEKLTRLETWNTEKQNYELKTVAAGAFAYMPKPSMQASEPPHWLCAACYQNGKKGFLQFRSQKERWHIYKCSICPSEICVPFNIHPGHEAPSRN